MYLIKLLLLLNLILYSTGCKDSKTHPNQNNLTGGTAEIVFDSL